MSTQDDDDKEDKSGRPTRAVVGSHRYVAPVIYHLTIAIRDAAGRAIIAESLARAIP